MDKAQFSSSAASGSLLARALRALACRVGRCEARLQGFTMLLPDGQLAVSCRQRLAELIGYPAASEVSDVDACTG